MAVSEEIKHLSAPDAINQLTEHIASNPEDDEAYYLRGMKYWSLGLRKEAINDFHSALRINPESNARMMLEFSNSVLDFYNKDLLNP